MEQYYLVVNLDLKEYLSPHIYDTGARLMDHSWIQNEFMNTIENLLTPNGQWYKNRIVWAGDYAEDGLFIDDLNHQYENLHGYAFEFYEDLETEKIKENTSKKYIINHTIKEYVDKTKIKDIKGWKVHPLSILTCSGNGRASGDYYMQHGDELYVGTWAGDIISIEDTFPDNYKEITPNFYK